MKQIVTHRVKSIALFTALVCAAGIVWADSPHYLKTDASIDSNSFCYSVSLKEVGLGTATSVTYSLSADACFTAACVTKKGHEVQGQPKSGQSDASAPTTLPVHGGQTTGTISLCPAAFTLPDPGCTGNQQLTITAASYTNVVLDDGPDLAAPVSLPSLSVGTCP